MDNRPIGFFDSGLGGLTCIPYLMKAMPEEKIIYFGDTARTPYGSKATSTIMNFSREIADFLVMSNVKMIVIACNTVSATCIEDLRERFPQIPILGIIDPAAKKVAEDFGSDDNVGIIGTKVTIASKAYERCIDEHDGKVNIHEVACPAFVPLIEEGIIENDIMDLTIKYYMDDFVKNNDLDAVILGCTHYPFVRPVIQELLGEEVAIFDGAEGTARQLRRQLDMRGLLNMRGKNGEVIWQNSSKDTHLIELSKQLLG